MEFLQDIDWPKLGGGVVAAWAAVWAAYQDFSEQPKWKKAAMVIGPVLLIGALVFVFG